MIKRRRTLAAMFLLVPLVACSGDAGSAEVLLLGGSVLDGSGADAVVRDVAVTGDRISFVGDAATADIEARDTLNVSGLLVTPGLIDMHSHAELDADYGREGQAFLYQGITSVVLGVWTGVAAARSPNAWVVGRAPASA